MDLTIKTGRFSLKTGLLIVNIKSVYHMLEFHIHFLMPTFPLRYDSSTIEKDDFWEYNQVIASLFVLVAVCFLFLFVLLVRLFIYLLLLSTLAHTSCKSDGSRASVAQDATNQQLPSKPWVMSCLLDPSTNRLGGSGAQMSCRKTDWMNPTRRQLNQFAGCPRYISFCMSHVSARLVHSAI